MIRGPLSLVLPCLLITEFSHLPCVTRKVLVLLRVIRGRRSRFLSRPDLSSIFHPTPIVIYFFLCIFPCVCSNRDIVVGPQSSLITVSPFTFRCEETTGIIRHSFWATE